jgi:hypothetical protein
MLQPDNIPQTKKEAVEYLLKVLDRSFYTEHIERLWSDDPKEQEIIWYYSMRRLELCINKLMLPSQASHLS